MKTKLLLLLFAVSTISISAQTFNWEGGTTINGGATYVRQTVSGVQAECTNSSNALQHIDGGGFAGSSGYIVTCGPNTTSLTVSFNTVINIQSIYAFDGNASAADDWTFTPVGGTNSNVIQSIGGTTGVNVITNWTNVTAFTITSANGVDRFAIDDIVFSIAPSCVINIPDTNFKNYLVNNTAINTNGDTEIQCSEASTFSGIIACGALNISTLTGIEAFTNISHLFCMNNNLTNIDVSANTELTLLNCENNNLTSLDVSANTELTQLLCGQNNLSNLNVSTNTNLYRLGVNNNNLTTINLSSNTTLGALICNDNNLNSLDISTNINLDELYCYNNNLTSLNTSTNTMLTSIDCKFNSIQSIDVSTNINLGALLVNNNQLTSLNIDNGNNSNINFMYAQNNTALSCIQIDTGFTPPNNSNWQKDTTAVYDEDCSSTLGVNNFELNENDINLYPNPTSSILNIEMKSNLKQATVYSILGVKVLQTTFKSINTSNLKSGVYLITIQAETGNVLTKRFIKQ